MPSANTAFTAKVIASVPGSIVSAPPRDICATFDIGLPNATASVDAQRLAERLLRQRRQRLGLGVRAGEGQLQPALLRRAGIGDVEREPIRLVGTGGDRRFDQLARPPPHSPASRSPDWRRDSLGPACHRGCATRCRDPRSAVPSPARPWPSAPPARLPPSCHWRGRPPRRSRAASRRRPRTTRDRAASGPSRIRRRGRDGRSATDSPGHATASRTGRRRGSAATPVVT